MFRKSTIWPDDCSFLTKGWKTCGMVSSGFEGSAGGTLVSCASDKEGVFLGFLVGGNDECVNRTVMPSDSWAPRRLLLTDDIMG